MKNTVIKTQEFYNYLVSKGKITGTKIGVDGVAGEKETIPAMKALYNKIYNTPELKQLQPITGIRVDDIFTDLATDHIVIPEGDKCYVVPASTKPGFFRVFNPIWIDGVFGVGVVVEGLYKRVWKWVYSTNYSSLWSGAPYGHQIGCAMRYYRDGDKNNSITRGTIYSGFKGFNLHSYKNWKTGWVWRLINKIFNISEGCQIIPYEYHEEVVPVITNLAKKDNDWLSYNLIKLADIK